MMRSVKFLSVAMLVLAITACTDIIPYNKPEVQQGVIISQAQVNQLQKGMTKAQVAAILGSPLIRDGFYTNQMVYIYTDKLSGEPLVMTRLILYFDSNGKLTSGEGTYQLPF
jgi:outer membrane protein assembly factor BamE